MSVQNTLAEQALSNLVNQFARPLDFLRELVQNSIDAGSPRVEIWTRFVPAESEEGVLEIHVDDWGEGMDEATIDGQLTEMFSSSKENDLTKIGKFGIGFTSIFAILPDAVLLHTGRHGENWELLFHSDRSFDKVRIDAPLDGTRITLFKRMAASAVDRFVRECRWTLEYWCEHSDTPIHFSDRTGWTGVDQPEDEDPFAAFGAPVPGADERLPDGDGAPGATRVNRPMAIEADLQIEHEQDGVRVIVGYSRTPGYGFYNGGLTLLKTSSADALGEFADELAHLSFKLKCNALEHTLTRDNVLQDQSWRAAMEVLRQAAAKLRLRLVERHEAAAASGEDLALLHRHLAAECRAAGLHKTADRFAERIHVLDHRGKPLSLAAVRAQERRVDAVLLAGDDAALAEALARGGIHLVLDHITVRELLNASWAPPAVSLGSGHRRVLPAGEIFVLPQLKDPKQLPADEQQLHHAASELMRAVQGDKVQLRLGDFGGPAAAAREALALEGPPEGEIIQRPQQTWFRLPGFLRRRCLLINRHHPTYRAAVLAVGHHVQLAAFGLVQAVLHEEGLVSDAVWDGLLEAGLERLSGARA